MDVSFKFHNEVPGAGVGFFPGERSERFKASHTMAEVWATFARTGKPSVEHAPLWPAYDLQNRPTMRIDTQCEVINNRFSEELAMWKSLGE
jgi:para-nitrobenzyl esterase